MGPIAEGRDIICLMETHEHDVCKTPVFDSYLKLAVWNKVAENGKGYGGILVLVKEKEGCHIQLMKEDENKQYLWFKISENENHIRITACYFSPQFSKTYKNKGLDIKDPYAALEKHIAMYYQ